MERSKTSEAKIRSMLTQQLQLQKLLLPVSMTAESDLWNRSWSFYRANKVKGAYAKHYFQTSTQRKKEPRLSNDANIACMGAFTIGNKLREELTDAFLTNEFVPGCSSQPKVDAFREYEAAHQK